MPAYNAERYILQSVESVLAQTYENFELLIVNDGSSDRTLDILSDISDQRIKVLNNSHNLGIVGSLNRAMAAARGRYIARIDADDCCMPTRFIKQKAVLDSNPGVLIVGTEMSVLERGQIKFTRQRADPDPEVLRWMLHVGNPVGHPSMMFRAEVIPALGEYLREEFKYAEDFDFSHRVLLRGNISVIPENLVIYRQHNENLTRTRRFEMISRTAAVLGDVYSALLSTDCSGEARLVAEHLIAGNPLEDAASAEQLGSFLNRLMSAFVAAYRLTPAQTESVQLHTGKLWWRTIQATLRAGRFMVPARCHGRFDGSLQTRPKPYQIARSVASGMVARRPWAQLARGPERPLASSPTLKINALDFNAVAVTEDDPPRLYVEVDTEAEFDWSKAFDRSMTNVSSMKQQILAQDIFDRYGARPIYVVDYAVASQPDGYEPLREIFERGACVIGAHLHPWVNPPFEEVISEYNSFGGNLPADLERRKLCELVSMIEANFGISPLFFKAGRYGIGPNTMSTLKDLGFVVDFSILPLADLRARGGPDFRFANAQPYRVGDGRILSIPMTRGQLGALTPLSPRVHSALRSSLATRLHLPGILSRTHLANTVTLTPEGVSSDEQIYLVQSMLARGCRTFVLHYHSPSLAKHTPYVRDETELRLFLKNLEAVCHFFFEELGGMPGNPADLVPPSMRHLVLAPKGRPAASGRLPSQTETAQLTPIVR